MTLSDASPAKLLATFNITDESIGNSATNELTPVPLVFYDRFADDDHSCSTPMFPTFPLIGADFQSCPPVSLHTERAQSTGVAFNIFSLLRVGFWDDPDDGSNPTTRHRESSGMYDSIETTTTEYHREHSDPYTGERSESDVITLDQVMYAKDLTERMSRRGHRTECDPAEVYVGNSFRYDATSQCLE